MLPDIAGLAVGCSVDNPSAFVQLETSWTGQEDCFSTTLPVQKREDSR